ncbi:MAG: ADP-ribosylglycohydrolase family protein [Verrucomicrobiae bacterium]|nr:ADP-ribosylglycohydrolase family protein [Verrucomicrobiae bacterium]
MKTLSLKSRIHGCWLGKSIGGTLGLPLEGRKERSFLRFYDPVPVSAPPNDDLELQLVWLHLLETRGLDLKQQDFADAWLAHIHYMWDEYGRCRWNLRRNVPLAEVGTFENPFHAAMGAPIRSEIWACLCPDNPGLAARYAALDASMDHGSEGIAGEVFLSVLQSLVIKGLAVREALSQALTFIGSETETERAISMIIRLHAQGMETWKCREQLLEQHGNENFTHAPLNLALTVWALLYGECRFEESILLAVNGGYDTDCTAATAGATLGFALGREGIPERWLSPIGEEVFLGNGILGIRAPRTLTELTERTLCQAKLLASTPEPALTLPPAKGNVDLQNLPGTISIQPNGRQDTVCWANGELPAAVKSAGGGTWAWQPGKALEQPHFLIGLARQGMRLWVDEKLVVDCPSGEPYVPATHRCPASARAAFIPTHSNHRIRVELNSCEELQEASVLLAAANLHLAMWLPDDLPYAPRLPVS